MTLGSPLKFDVKSVAIIGAGPSGIASLYELSRVTEQGGSLFGIKDISEYEKSGDLAFPELVCFERNSSVGGVWSKTISGNNIHDPNIPSLEEDPSKPENIYKKIPITDKLEENLKSSTAENPFKVPLSVELDNTISNQWRNSAAYDGLFTNVTNRYMMFSFHEKVDKELKNINNKYKHIPNFQSAGDLSDYLEEAVSDNHLEKYIRLNTNVERVRKLSNGKWEVVVSYVTQENNIKYLNWYKQCFDAVIIGNGKTIPIVPNIKGFAEFAEANKDTVEITLAKSIDDPSFLRKMKKPLFIGSSVSSIDLIQYAFPRDIENPSIYLSRRSDLAHSDWITFCSYFKGLINKPTIEEFITKSNSVKFSDGSIETGFDAIVICTGYHKYYPFIESSFLKLHQSDALTFYKYTFSLADPTLALVGNAYAPFFFNRVESQAAAIAGVWGNFKSLPSFTEQKEDAKISKSLFVGTVDENFIKPLMQLSINKRPHPFTVNKEKLDHVAHTAIGTATIQSLFLKLRDGEIDHENIFE